jgi:uncharacterized alpha-E superfamily protein
MLSRVADSLFWMSRYMERAENTARILDINLQLLLDLPKTDEKALNRIWASTLRSCGDEREFFSEYDEANGATVIDFLTHNAKNHNSIANCIIHARENARHVREQISDEMWERLNRFYLDLRSRTGRKGLLGGLDEFFQAILQASQLFQGTTDATMAHGMGWHFIQAGKYVERADKTTRLVDSNADVLTPAESERNRAGTTLRLAAILRSCSGHAAYRRVYVADVRAVKVVEFLVLNEEFPRSIRFCVGSLDDALRHISGNQEERFTNQAEKLAGRLQAELNYSSVEDVLGPGLHKTMDGIQRRLIEVGNAIAQTYMGVEKPLPLR